MQERIYGEDYFYVEELGLEVDQNILKINPRVVTAGWGLCSASCRDYL